MKNIMLSAFALLFGFSTNFGMNPQEAKKKLRVFQQHARTGNLNRADVIEYESQVRAAAQSGNGLKQIADQLKALRKSKR